MPVTDPVSMIAALVVIFSVAAVVWLMIAVGLRESPWGCASLAGANGLLALSFLLYDRAFIPPVLPAHAWWPDTLSLAAFGLVRLSVPLIGERPAPWRNTFAVAAGLPLVAALLGLGPETLSRMALLFGAMGGFAAFAALDAFRLLRWRSLRGSTAFTIALPLLVMAMLVWSRPLVAVLLPAHAANLDVRSPFNVAWLWASVVLALALNGWMAFLLLTKLVLQIRRLTERDPLTDALNRRALSQAMDVEHARQMRGHGYALVLLDMDRFKQLNDTLGHAAGDAALQALVAIASPCLREVDLLGRLGGEEFCALLPHTDIAGATLVAERMRAVLEALPFEWNGQVWSLTASFGVAESSGQDVSAAEVMRRADQALYRAKGQGRNVVQAVERVA
ncbi:MAG: GGDEF domain-containing protein [Mitsuaria chitosanitabida]|jgi:diguanylate cyclase (GGDEF)-like protein|uniref:GGDEF domain-containing protein n=1 Tax=Roseateles chitosanitabidus TaxID=65048 RepID=UPI001B0613D7|nr:GGDEF domain-containing protein [Roseateles chitosanitabidus]MBO9687973.1 GGDEF domain-containing protein [Roseateles chitosanitabidus]